MAPGASTSEAALRFMHRAACTEGVQGGGGGEGEGGGGGGGVIEEAEVDMQKESNVCLHDVIYVRVCAVCVCVCV